jgi:hypothetical protein
MATFARGVVAESSLFQPFQRNLNDADNETNSRNLKRRPKPLKSKGKFLAR